MELYCYETTNGYNVCGVAKYLGAEVEFVRVDLLAGEHKLPEFLAINPNGKIPALVDGDVVVWESAAIIAYLSHCSLQKSGSELWSKDPLAQIQVLKWVAWEIGLFSPHAGAFYFENVIKSKFGFGEPDLVALVEPNEFFQQFAAVLDQHLVGKTCLVGEQLTIADFGVDVLLAVADLSHLEFSHFPEIVRWHEQLMSIPAWRNSYPTI
jgi:glutathione S-transferase